MFLPSFRLRRMLSNVLPALVGITVLAALPAVARESSLEKLYSEPRGRWSIEPSSKNPRTDEVQLGFQVGNLTNGSMNSARVAIRDLEGFDPAADRSSKTSTGAFEIGRAHV